MERLRVVASLGLVLAAILGCRSLGSKKDEPQSTEVPTAEPSDTAAPTEDSPDPSDKPSAAAAASAAPQVKLQDCGERYAAPARLDGKCADYCGKGYACDPAETCIASSWPTKSGVRNVAVCTAKGVAVRAPVAGAAWDSKAPPFTAGKAPAKAKTCKPDEMLAGDLGCIKECLNDKECGARGHCVPIQFQHPSAGLVHTHMCIQDVAPARRVLPTPAATVDFEEVDGEGITCPPGWVHNPHICNRPCKVDADCHGKNKCQSLNGDRFCDVPGHW